MVQDRFHIEMVDISKFPIERSADYAFWEDISHEELNEQVLAGVPEDKLKRFLEVVRTGTSLKMKDYFYRIKAN